MKYFKFLLVFLTIATHAQSIDYCEKCDLYLGGLFPIHEPGAMSESCGRIKKERGVQRLEAMLFAIDLINNSTSILPGIRLGAKIFDTCDRDTIALEKSINFIKDHFLLNQNYIESDFQCEAPHNRTPSKKVSDINRRKVVSVIGAASSSVSVQVANILRLYKIPQISYASTSPDLSNRQRFPYFSRVLPSDTLQAKGMATLVKALKWNYVATLSEDGNLGGIDAFVRDARIEDICISGSYRLSQTATDDDVKRIINDIAKMNNSKAIVMFLQDHNIKKLLQIVHDLGLDTNFLFVASDSWGTKKEHVLANSLVAEGAISFAPKSYIIKEFDDYFRRLTPKNNHRNPWFIEFWETQFNCSFSSGAQRCTGNEHLDVKQDGFIHFVVDSVFAMAHALDSLIRKHCPTMKCSNLFSLINGDELLEAIRNVEFNSITGRRVKFLKSKENLGDGIITFEVFQYQSKINLSQTYDYQKIAEWDSDEDVFSIDMSRLKWRYGSTLLPKSVCKDECEPGEIKQGDICCWVCVKCEENQYTDVNQSRCISCDQGYGPNANRSGCVKLPIEYMMLDSPFSFIPIAFSSFGILVAIYTIVVFIKFSDTPIIKASGRELCYVLLAGIISCYSITFPLVTKPNLVSCAVLRFGTSLSLTVCLSALFTKTNRLSRIFNNSIKNARQASYVSPKSQLVICFCIIFVQILGLTVWLVLSPPGMMYDYEDAKRVVLQCKTQNFYLIVSLSYNILLMILCTTYAIKTRKIPENFNEARFIGFTMYSICIIWCAFVPIYFGTSAATGKSYKNNYKIQLSTLAMCISLSATVVLVCLFVPKLKIVLLKPDKNVRGKAINMKKPILTKKNDIVCVKIDDTKSCESTTETSHVKQEELPAKSLAPTKPFVYLKTNGNTSSESLSEETVMKLSPWLRHDAHERLPKIVELRKSEQNNENIEPIRITFI